MSDHPGTMAGDFCCIINKDNHHSNVSNDSQQEATVHTACHGYSASSLAAAALTNLMSFVVIRVIRVCLGGSVACCSYECNTYL